MAPLFPTPPLTIVNRPAASTHYTRGRGGHKPGYILVHHSGGRNSLDWLTHTSDPPVSTQRLIDKIGTNFKIVKDEDTAYTAGYGLIGPIDPDASDPAGAPRNLNVVSLNIELENLGTGRDPYPEPQMQMCAWQIVEWWGAYGLLPLLGHNQVDPNKHDPAGFDWADLHRRILTRLLTVLAPQPSLPSGLVAQLEAAHRQAAGGIRDLVAALALLRGEG